MRYLAIALLAASIIPIDAADVRNRFFVDPAGDDADPGTLAQPFATLGRARDAVRAVNAAMTGDVHVVLRGGTYRLDETLRLDGRDAGSNGYSVVWTAYPGETPVVSGGTAIEGWSDRGEGVWVADATALAFRQLYVDGRIATRAREPDGTYWRTVDRDQANRLFHLDPAHIDGSWQNLANVELVVQHSWSASHVHIESFTDLGTKVEVVVPEPERTRLFSQDQSYQGTAHVFRYDPDRPFHWENTVEFLDEPGEWYLDRTAGQVLYIPLPGEDPSALPINVGTLETLVEVRGELDGDRPHHIAFRGITFAHTDWLLPSAHGYRGHQATTYEVDTEAWPGVPVKRRFMPEAVRLEAAHHVTFEGCTFTELGDGAIGTTFAASDNTYRGNRFAEVVGNGLTLNRDCIRRGAYGWGGVEPDRALVCERERIVHNEITRVGWGYLDGVGIFAGFPAAFVVDRNELSDLPYTGISMGWGWDTTVPVMHDNLVRRNHIHHVMALLADGGGIYTQGEQTGSHLYRNHLNDLVLSEFANQKQTVNGLYFDQGSSFITYESNSMENVHKPVQIHYHSGTGNLTGIDTPSADPTVAAEAGRDTTPPDAPANLVASASGAQVALSWDAAVDGESGIIRYHVHRAGDPLPIAAVDGATTSYADHGTAAGGTLSYTVSAVNEAGLESPPSAAASADLPFAVVPGDGLVAQGYPGGPSHPASKTYTVVNASAGAIDWSAATDVAWATIDGSGSGTLAAGATAEVTVRIDDAATAALAVGGHAGTLSVTDLASGTVATRPLSLELFDDALAIDLPASVREDAGSVSGHLRIAAPLAGDLVVDLSSSDPSAATVPATVTIPAGWRSVSLVATIVDDAVADGTQAATIAAVATGFTSAEHDLAVGDDEVHHFTIDPIADPQIAAVPFAVTATARTVDGVTIADYGRPVTLSASGDGGALPIDPASPAAFVDGTWTGSIDIPAVDTGVAITLDDGTGHTGTSNRFAVIPGPHVAFSIDTIPAEVLVGERFPIAIDAVDANGFRVPTFTGTADLAVYPNGEPPRFLAGSVSSNTSSHPFHTSSHKARTQNIYLASELGDSADRILGITLDVVDVPGVPLRDWTVRIKHTQLDSYAFPYALESDGWTIVHQAATFEPTDGPVYIPFQQPFAFNGVDNLMVDFSFSIPDTASDGRVRATYHNNPRMSLVAVGSAADGDPLSWDGTTGPGPSTDRYRANLTFHALGTPLPASPASTTAFAGGAWSGTLQVDATQAAAGLFVYADTGQTGGSNLFDVVETYLVLSLPARASEGDGVLAGAGAVELHPPLAADLVVSLTSAPDGQVVVPSTVLIPAGQASVSFDVEVIDDSAVEGTHTASVDASASGAVGATAAMLINDNEPVQIGLSVPAQAREGDGLLSGQGLVQLDAAPVIDVTVELAGDDGSEVRLPTASVVVAAGTDQAAFDLEIVDDGQIDGTQTVALTAHVPGWSDGRASIDVQDDEHRNLTVTAPAAVAEGDGTLAGAGLIGIDGTLPYDLVVALASDDATEIQVAAETVIPAGATAARFDLIVVDDADPDGRQNATITAAATGFTDGGTTCTVHDSEVVALAWSAVSSPQLVREAIAVRIDALDIDGEPALGFRGSAQLSATGDGGAVGIVPDATAAFASGSWAGTVAVQELAAGVVLEASAGSASGSSTPFDVVAGPAAAFVVDPAPSPQRVDVPFDISVTALDRHGFPATSFDGPVDLGVFAVAEDRLVGDPGFSPIRLPLATADSAARTQTIYPASFVGAAGVIDRIALKVAVVPDVPVDNWVVRMKHTVQEEYPIDGTWDNEGWQEVHRGTLIVEDVGWVAFDLDVPFYFNGADNLAIDFSFQNQAGGADGLCHRTGGAVYRSLFAATSSHAGSPLEWSDAVGPAPSRARFTTNLRFRISGPIATAPDASGTFAGGTWSGGISAGGPARPGYVAAYDAAGRSGVGPPLAVIGPHDGLAVDHVPSPQHAAVPFPVTIRSVDAQGSHSSDFAGTAGLTALAPAGSPVLVDRGTGSWEYPLNSFEKGSRVQCIYPASWIGAGGVIGALDLDVQQTSGGTFENLTIRMKHTALDAHTGQTWDDEGWTTVFHGEVAIDRGWLTIDFDRPFRYDGGDNLMIDISHYGSASYTSYCGRSHIDSTSWLSLYHASSTEGDPLDWRLDDGPTGTRSSYVPDLRLHFLAPVASTPTTTGSFTSGSWTGDLTVQDHHPLLFLEADDGSGHVAFSDRFRMPGPAEAFAWDPLPPTVLAGRPFTATVRAVDAHGLTDPRFTGRAELGLAPGAAPPVVEVSGGGGDFEFPLHGAAAQARTQSIYTAGELGGAGRIASLSLRVDLNHRYHVNRWTIRMKHTALDEFPAGAGWETDGWTVVHQGDLAIGLRGWHEIPLDVPFAYNGTDHLMIDYSYDGVATISKIITSVRPSDTIPVRSLTAASDGSHGDPLLWAGATDPAPTSWTWVPAVRIVSVPDLPLSPTATGSFTAGVWTGQIAIPEPATGIGLMAFGAGHDAGLTPPFEVFSNRSVVIVASDGAGLPIPTVIQITPDHGTATEVGGAWEFRGLDLGLDYWFDFAPSGTN